MFKHTKTTDVYTPDELIEADQEWRSKGVPYEFRAEPMFVQMAHRIIELERRLNKQDGNSST